MKIREQLSRIIDYGPSENVNTPTGKCSIRRGLACRDFWALYHDHHQELTVQGVTFAQVNGKWWVTESTTPLMLKPQHGLHLGIQEKLFPWQIKPANDLLEVLNRRLFALDMSEAGTGKTAVACAVAKARGKPLVVMCAKYARPEWLRMANYFECNLIGISHWELVRMGKTELGKFEMMKLRMKTKSKEVKVFSWNPEYRKSDALLVIDEIHNCGGLSSLNSLMAIGTKRSCIRTLGLSATAADNPLRMAALAYLTGLIADPGLFFRWAHRYGVVRTSRGMSFYDNREPNVLNKRKEVMLGIHRSIKDNNLSVRVRKSDIPGFPKNQIMVLAIDCSANERVIAKEYQAIFRTIQEMNLNNITVSDAKRVISKSRQKIELLKIPTIVNMVNDSVGQDIRQVVFVNYRATAIALGKALGVPILIGSQSEKDRYAAMLGFYGSAETRPSHQSVVSTYGAGSESINLNDAFGWGPCHALLFPTFRAQHIVQAANRVWRANSKTPSIQQFVFASGTIEVDTMNTLRSRISQLDMMNDGQSQPMPDHRLVDNEGD